MDAWESLVSGSTIASGDAWEHLQAQGGEGTATYLVLANGLGVEMGANDIDIEIAAGIEATVDQSPKEVDL